MRGAAWIRNKSASLRTLVLRPAVTHAGGMSRDPLPPVLLGEVRALGQAAVAPSRKQTGVRQELELSRPKRQLNA